MARVTLVHWNAEEAARRLAQLRAAGHAPVHWAPTSGNDLKALDPTDLVVIDLTRVPSRGRDVGSALRRGKATRHIPLLFLDGVQDKVERVRSVLPDASYGDWAHLRAAVKLALKPVPAKPAVPDAMAGYSGTPLARKLIIRENDVVALIDAPDDIEEKLAPLPANVRFMTRLSVQAGVILLFCLSRHDLESQFHSAANALVKKGRLWLAWPKKSSGIQSDLTEPFVREYGLAQGFVDYKICAIDATWSGLCFARR
ncbi:hypothetical protein [Paludibaculum fermentans]|uniref:DUF3052 domain-containing protein n=1 Tax=Paludibaculum fermentans TaxID=1473598 RepID=A0A7S7NJX9_PALFE|nr:hypothetical protein [Paludibaculum fermentans]QOY84930.1 hypothetical protein IRI77_18910 [Paludibaculum fermentans]